MRRLGSAPSLEQSIRRPVFLFAFVAVASVLAVVACCESAWAQSAPQMQAQVDQDTVGVGDVLHFELTAQSAEGMPSDPQPGATPGFVVRGQNSAPSQTHIIMNGSRTDRYGLTIDWTLQAVRVGTFRLGPPTVVVGGIRYKSPPATVRVVPAGQAPRRPAQPQQPQSPFGFSPFDPWKGLIPGFDQLDPQAAPQQSLVTIDPKLSLDHPRGANYFLHATLDQASAVIGEQVTFSVYEYIDAGAAGVEVDGSDIHDPAVADFVKHPLLREDQDAVLVGYAAIDGRTWVVKLVRRWALFPLRAGDLEIGPMSVMLSRPRGAGGGNRTTEALRVHVTEPPRAGRPPGYALGDVGHYALSAQVAPRDVEQGGAVGVHLEIAGTGNVPSAITTPVRDGLEWLAPEVHEQLAPQAHDKFGGKRTFDFVVRVRRAGDLDLGQMMLPFWDPEQKRYDVARAALGIIHAKASASAAAQEAAPQGESLPGLPAVRETLEGTRAPHAHPDDSPIFWIACIGAWPLAFGVGVAGRSAGRSVRRALHARRVSPEAELKERVAAATAACASEDARKADAAIARALEAATVAHAAVSVRGAVGDEVLARLEQAGIGHEAASRLAELLRECEKARFAPDAADVAHARERWLRARGAIRELERRQ